MVNHELACLARKMRRWSGASRFFTSPPSLASLASSPIFFCHTFPSWVPEGHWQWIILFPPSQPKSALCLHVANLGTFSQRTSQDFGGPGRPSRLALHLEFLRGVWEISIFWKKGVSIRFPKEAYLILWTCLLYYLWPVVKISTPIVLHVPLRSNFIGGIYPPLF